MYERIIKLYKGIALARDRSRSKRKGRRHQKIDENWHVTLMGKFLKRNPNAGPLFLVNELRKLN